MSYNIIENLSKKIALMNVISYCEIEITKLEAEARMEESKDDKTT